LAFLRPLPPGWPGASALAAKGRKPLSAPFGKGRDRWRRGIGAWGFDLGLLGDPRLVRGPPGEMKPGAFIFSFFRGFSAIQDFNKTSSRYQIQRSSCSTQISPYGATGSGQNENKARFPTRTPVSGAKKKQ